MCWWLLTMNLFALVATLGGLKVLLFLELHCYERLLLRRSEGAPLEASCAHVPLGSTVSIFVPSVSLW